jgi:DNA-directed RNA polymerase specialized sigma24 family protein
VDSRAECAVSELAGDQPEKERRPERRKRPVDGSRAALNRKARDVRLRFLRSNDADAFRELVLLLEAPLLPVAHALTRELGLALPATQLLADHFAELFTDLRDPVIDEPDVLGAAEAAMRRLAEARLEALRQATACGEARPDLLPNDAREYLRSLAGPANLGARFLVIVNHAFHDLSEDDRRVLLAADVDRTPLLLIARDIGLRESLALRRVRKARVRLAASIAAHFISLSGSDRDPPGPAGRMRLS